MFDVLQISYSGAFPPSLPHTGHPRLNDLSRYVFD